MKKTFLLLFLCLTTGVFAERIEPIPFGDMESWVVRYVQESKLLGGKTRTLYALAPTDTIWENGPYYYGQNGNPWATSNAYANIIGIEKAAGTMTPEAREDGGTCCRMDVDLLGVRVMGMIDVQVLVPGTLFTGRNLEPITTAADPYQNIDFGVPFTQHPVALMLDYKATISEADSLITTERNKPEWIDGHDCAVVFVYLQYRWEDKETGKIYARRVGTAYERICETIPEWVNNHEIPIRWGNITTSVDYQAYEGLNQCDMMTRNSRGKMVRVEEVGWSLDEPTHVVMYISSSNAGVFRAYEGNTLWVDNLRWVYESEE